MKELTKSFDCYHVLKSDVSRPLTALATAPTITSSMWCHCVICVVLILYLYLFCFCLSGEDVWSYAKGLPHMFQQGGVFYNIMKKTMGIVKLWFYLWIMILFKVYKIKNIQIGAQRDASVGKGICCQAWQP